MGPMNTADLTRRLENLIRLGTIAEVDHAAARCRVKTGGLLTAWLPWLTQRAGADTTWHAPSVSEQCVVFSPSGDPAHGVVLFGLYSTQHPAPDNSAARHRQQYCDGAVLDYDTATNTLTATLPAGGKVNVTAPGGVTIAGNVSITGNVAVTGQVAVTQDVTAGGISVMNHTHPGVQGGLSSTGKAQ
ncbi:phage baseplate assembly protein V [Pseudomonas daroniae]|nr:phage baseplate assembly protein V [Pseudomonas daroniae]